MTTYSSAGFGESQKLDVFPLERYLGNFFFRELIGFVGKDDFEV